MYGDIGGGAHFDAGDDADGEEGGHQGTAAITEEGQRKADDREQAQTYADIDQDLEQEHGGNADADQPVHIVRGLHADIDAARDDGQQQKQHRQTADQTELLADGAEDGVRVAGRQGGGVRQIAVEQPLTGKTAVAQCLQVLVGLPENAFARGVNGRVDQRENAFFLVRTHDVLPQIGADCGKGCAAAEEPPAAHAAGIGHDQENENKDQRHAHVL